MQPSTILASALAISSVFQNSKAEPLQAQFTAIVTSTSATSELPAIGTKIRGAITFNYDLASHSVANDCGPDCTSYFYASAPYLFNVDLGSSAITTQYANLAVSDNTSILDPLSPAKDVVEFSTKLQAVGYNLTLSGPSSSFWGTAIPSIEALTTLAQEGNFYITSPSFDKLLTAKISSFSVSPIPEPATTLLFSFGIFAISTMRGKSRDIKTRWADELS